MGVDREATDSGDFAVVVPLLTGAGMHLKILEVCTFAAR